MRGRPAMEDIDDEDRIDDRDAVECEGQQQILQHIELTNVNEKRETRPWQREGA